MRPLNHGSLVYGSLAYLLGQLTILSPYVVVDTNYGRVQGVKSIARDGRPYAEFLNIPYAKPPIGDLRFEPPERPFKWTGVQDATYYGNSCLQYEFLTHFLTGSEDCLNLNIYTPNLKILRQNEHASQPKDDVRLYPVIVFFYGGIFMSGFSYIYRAKYFMEEDVILVTVNYRVGSFGFLNTADGLIRGNMGLKDQVMALQWVNENIVNFGGDPKSITLMGQSAGGASAHFHMLSELSKGLFHRVISMSGSALNIWSSSRYPKIQSEMFADRLGCLSTNRTKMVSCLKGVKAHRIASYHKAYLSAAPDVLTLFSPSVEVVDDGKAFLTQNPRLMVESGKFPNHVPWIIGVTNGEGLIGSGYLVKQPEAMKKIDLNWDIYAAQQCGYLNHPKRIEISRKIRNFYLGNESITPDAFERLTKLYSYITFYQGVYESVILQLKNSKAPIFAYYLTYARDYGFANFLDKMTGGIHRFPDYLIGATRTWTKSKIDPSKVRKFGVCHGDDLQILFNIPTAGDEITSGSEDYPFSQAYVKLMVQFARDGNPGSLFGVKWRPLEKNHNGTFPLFEISEFPGYIPIPFRDSITFWQQLWKEYDPKRIV